MGIICSFCQKLHQPDIGVTYFDSRRERRVVLKFNEETGADFNAGNCIICSRYIASLDDKLLQTGDDIRGDKYQEFRKPVNTPK